MEPFEYISTLISIIIGLGITHLLVGVSRLVYNPKGIQIYWIHLLWTLSIFVYLVFFWWWEANLIHIYEWTFQFYLFIVFFAVLLFLAAMLNMPFYFPENFKEYYYDSRKWFFGIIIVIYVADIMDTLLKGSEHTADLGLEYFIFMMLNITLGVIAFLTRKELLHGFIAISFVLFNIWYGITAFNTLPM